MTEVIKHTRYVCWFEKTRTGGVYCDVWYNLPTDQQLSDFLDGGLHLVKHQVVEYEQRE